jgi:hypothetical protein
MKTFNLKTPFRNEWQFQIIFGSVSSERGKEKFEECEEGYISDTDMRRYHRGFLNFCVAMDTIPAQGDLIEIENNGLNRVFERWIVPDEYGKK